MDLVTTPSFGDPVTFAGLAAWCDRIMAANRFHDTDDPAGVWRPGPPEVHAVGLLLNPWPDIGAWVAAERLDAIIIHRPWRLPLDDLAKVGVLAYHLAFDERLTLGHNPWLATELGILRPEVLDWKDGRPIGMIGAIPATPFIDLVATLERTFGALDTIMSGRRTTVERIAVAGAMTDQLVREAAARGADLYLTGQFRSPARIAVDETGIGVLTAGHARSERWALGLLTRLLTDQWPRLRLVIAP